MPAHKVGGVGLLDKKDRFKNQKVGPKNRLYRFQDRGQSGDFVNER